MGKGTSLENKNKIIYKKEKNLNNFLTENEIKILEKINKKFVRKIIKILSDLIKSNIELNFYTIKVNSYTNQDKNLKLLYSNFIEIIPVKKKSFIFFSSNFLSVFIDFLFGGNGSAIKNNIKKNITYTEGIINKKLIEIIMDTYCKSCKDFFYINMQFNSFSIIDIEKNFFDKNDFFITNYFNFNLNGIKIFLSILLPYSIVKQKNVKQKNNEKINPLDKNLYSKKNIFIKKTCDIEVDIFLELILSPVLKNTFNNLSEGDVINIENPEKIVAYIEKKPFFIGKHKIFNKKSIVFLEKFIHQDQQEKLSKEKFNE